VADASLRIRRIALSTKVQWERISIAEFWLAMIALHDYARRRLLGRRLPLGAGTAKQSFADMRSLSIVCFGRTFGTAAPG